MPWESCGLLALSLVTYRPALKASRGDDQCPPCLLGKKAEDLGLSGAKPPVSFQPDSLAGFPTQGPRRHHKAPCPSILSPVFPTLSELTPCCSPHPTLAVKPEAPTPGPHLPLDHEPSLLPPLGLSSGCYSLPTFQNHQSQPPLCSPLPFPGRFLVLKSCFSGKFQGSRESRSLTRKADRHDHGGLDFNSKSG